jgi:hypothetical protein
MGVLTKAAVSVALCLIASGAAFASGAKPIKWVAHLATAAQVRSEAGGAAFFT